MKTLLDLAYGDIRSLTYLCFDDEYVLNVAAYHIQQAYEKVIKFILEMEGVPYPKTNNLVKLGALVPSTRQHLVNLNANDLLYITSYEASSRYDPNFHVTVERLEYYTRLVNECYLAVKNLYTLPEEIIGTEFLIKG